MLENNGLKLAENYSSNSASLMASSVKYFSWIFVNGYVCVALPGPSSPWATKQIRKQQKPKTTTATKALRALELSFGLLNINIPSFFLFLTFY